MMMILLAVVLAAGPAAAQDAASKAKELSYKSDVKPLIQKYCISCHAEEEFNPSEYSMDTYALVVKGGKNGPAVVPGKSSESSLVQKLWEKPPFGERMPLNSKKKVAAGKARWLSAEEIRVFAEWVDQGGKDN
jgi:hypothetical protein